MLAFRQLFFLFGAVLALGVPAAESDTAGWYHSLGNSRFALEDYDGAIDAYERAIERAPRVSEYHRLLGRTYGRLAEESGWLRAIGLAKKTRIAFERSVELDGANLEALSDLMQYYERAPGFLGGGQEKAEGIRDRLARLCAGRVSEACEAGDGRSGMKRQDSP